MRVSVVMTTYNGSKYIKKQLDSIRNQSLKADEVIICDDCSTDGTCRIIKEYISERSLNNWFFYQNKCNIGWVDNFHQAYDKAIGDYVFLCDQDDIWNENKISTMVDCLIQHPEIGVLACRMKLIDGDGNRLKDSPNTIPFTSKNTGKIEKEKLTTKIIYAISPGCTMVVRNSFIEFTKLMPEAKKLPHDALFWKVGILTGKAYVLDMSLIDYRLHKDNASSPLCETQIRIKKIENRINEATKTKMSMSYLIDIYDAFPLGERSDSIKKILMESQNFCENRIKLLERKYKSLIKYSLRYFKYYRNFRMFFGDICSIYLSAKEE